MHLKAIDYRNTKLNFFAFYSMEHRLAEATAESEDDSDEDAEMRRRIQLAKLVRLIE
jgi:hypothetical protein